MPAKPSTRQYRTVQLPLTVPTDATGKRIDSKYYVEGYASTFEDPYTLYSTDQYDVREVIARDAFVSADMSDIIMQFDHAGKVYARKSNGTLIVEPDDHGLFVAADLSKSAAARELYEEIAAGLITRMSWCFTVGDRSYDPDTHTIRINSVRKVYDVSAVSLPADPNTEISARSLHDGAIEQLHGESVERERMRALARIRISQLI